LTNDGQSWAVGGFSYPMVDNPTATPGPVVPQVQSGLALNDNIPEGTEAPLVDINIGAGFPASGLLIGVMLQPGGDAMSSVRLTQTAGSGSGRGSATTSVAPLSNLTFEFFTLTGAQPGDRYTLYMINTSGFNPNVTYSGLTFDTLATVPEPASCGIFVSGMMIALVRRRRA
jgi:hypothetical protein